MALNTRETGLTCTALIEKLREKRMNSEWTWSRYGLTTGNGKIYAADELIIVYSQHFDECSDPIGAHHIYVIKADNELIGFCLDAAGTYTDPSDKAGFEEFIGQIPVADEKDQLNFRL